MPGLIVHPSPSTEMEMKSGPMRGRVLVVAGSSCLLLIGAIWAVCSREGVTWSEREGLSVTESLSKSVGRAQLLNSMLAREQAMLRKDQEEAISFRISVANKLHALERGCIRGLPCSSRADEAVKVALNLAGNVPNRTVEVPTSNTQLLHEIGAADRQWEQAAISEEIFLGSPFPAAKNVPSVETWLLHRAKLLDELDELDSKRHSLIQGLSVHLAHMDGAGEKHRRQVYIR